MSQFDNVLYGRQYDVAQLCQMLCKPDYRLISIVGSGGIGKTHLAKQIITQVESKFADGVHFIQLQAIESADHILTALMDAIGETLYGSTPPIQQIQRHLHDKQLLLVLDNFEHLMDSAEFIVSILDTAPQVKVLITSREVLNVTQEWVWTLTGLGFPNNANEVGNLNEYAAIQMFVDRARHIDPTFDVKIERENVIHLCQLLEGIPLAINMASPWLRTFTCGELVEEISQDIDILSTRLRDVPDHHRSIRIVFDHSWGRLSAREQHTIKCLSIFRGTFSRDAAQYISAASVTVLTTLIEKSLLQTDESGRYTMHTLLRQYIREKLDDPETVYSRVAQYYGQFIADLYPDNINKNQGRVTQIFVQELDNLRPIWSYMCGAVDAKTLRITVALICDLYQFKAYYHEGMQVLRDMLTQLQSASFDHNDGYALKVETSVYVSWFSIRLGNISEAERLLDKAQQLSEAHHIVPIPALGSDPRMGLGIVKTIRGAYKEVIELGKALIKTSQDNHDLTNEAGGWYVISSAALAHGDYDVASDAVDHALDCMRRTGNKWFMTYLLNQRGQIAVAKGEYRTAQRYIEESFELREEFDDPESMIVPLTHLAKIAVLQADFDRALDYFKKSQKMSLQLGDKGWFIQASEGLGVAYLACEAYQEAHHHLVEALSTVPETELPSLLLQVVNSVARFMVETGNIVDGLQYISFVYHHPLTENEVREIAESSLAHYRDTVSPGQFTYALTSGKRLTIEKVTQQLKHDFAFYTWDENFIKPRIKIKQPLIEPLTDRELEVLNLLGKGLTNSEIAENLTVVVGTVKTHNYNIFGKLGVKNRVQAVKQARELQLISP